MLEKFKKIFPEDKAPKMYKIFIINVLGNALGKQMNITMISGEIIKGKVVQSNKVTVHVEVQQSYDQEELEQAIQVFGKDYVENHLMKPTTILTLPIDEIIGLSC